MNQAVLDRAYDNTSAVPNSAQIIASWESRSAAIASAYPHSLDRHYGERERNRIDYFPAHARGAPVLVFIHGGYWQMRAKETFRFLAAGPLAHGISFATIGYTLAPQARLAEIVQEIQSALSWLAVNVRSYGGDADRIYVSGWSAGGHLSAMSLAHPAVRGGLAISGIYDLAPIRLSYLNEKLKLAEADVFTLSPLSNIPSMSPRLVIAYGRSELPELQRQSNEFAHARSDAGLPGKVVGLEGHDHFSILEELASPEGQLTRLVRDLIDG